MDVDEDNSTVPRLYLDPYNIIKTIIEKNIQDKYAQKSFLSNLFNKISSILNMPIAKNMKTPPPQIKLAKAVDTPAIPPNKSALKLFSDFQDKT